MKINKQILAASLAAFCVYFCTYAFRKPFTAASYEGLFLGFLDYKTVLVLSQVIGYTISKFIGIRVISSVSKSRRAVYLIGLILIAEFSLLGFALTPYPYNFPFLLLNGLPLGMVWGLVFAYLEGRKTTELLAVSQALSFVVSSAIVKAVGKYVMDSWQVSQFWMPFITGLLFFIPLLLFVLVLERTPPPDVEDEIARIKRKPMTARDRRTYFLMIAPGLLLLCTAAVLLTIYREIRDNYTIEILSALGYGDKAGYLAYSEIVVAVLVLFVFVFIMYVKSNESATIWLHALMAAGLLLICASTPLFTAGLLNGYWWFTITGIGLYMAYVPFHGILFDRLIAFFGKPGNAGYLIYVVDAFGYLGSGLVLVYKAFFAESINWLVFFINMGYIIASTGAICLGLALIYFLYRKKQLDTINNHQKHQNSMSNTTELNEQQLLQWNRDGFLKIENFFSAEEAEAIKSWVDEISNWEISEDKWMHHYETINSEAKLSRTENFVPFHPGMKNLLTEGKVIKVLSSAIGEEVVLYKEKINYKYAGGGGYAAHQDAPAYDNIQKHVTCLFPVDNSSVDNGCLFFAPGMHQQGLISPDERGCIQQETTDKMNWVPVEATHRDIVLFHSFAPHKSGRNDSQLARRALYLTYNALSEGDLRGSYYNTKRENFKRFKEEGDEKANRISNIGHFEGQTVSHI